MNKKHKVAPTVAYDGGSTSYGHDRVHAQTNYLLCIIIFLLS